MKISLNRNGGALRSVTLIAKPLRIRYEESYGFSNNVKVLFGPPSFNKARFLVNFDSMKIEVNLK